MEFPQQYNYCGAATMAGGFHRVGMGPEEHEGHADTRFDTMKEDTPF